MAKFISKFIGIGSLIQKLALGGPSKITSEMKAIFEARMRDDDKTIAYQLHVLLVLHGI